MDDQEDDLVSFMEIVKEGVLGGLGGIVGGIVITIFCAPMFGLVAFVFWLFLKFY